MEKQKTWTTEITDYTILSFQQLLIFSNRVALIGNAIPLWISALVIGDEYTNYFMVSQTKNSPRTILAFSNNIVKNINSFITYQQKMNGPINTTISNIT